ncbi:hypothetical protein PT974_04395 [Cladobotryum mycophilum]|uniref:Uncharacterized protein n=1 Tax=Cladobotryum mycophilum TaxID=491253 RepID=A0ABR0SW32_9HYPO
MSSTENKSSIQPEQHPRLERAENPSTKKEETTTTQRAPLAAEQEQEQAITGPTPEHVADEAEMERRRYGEAQPQVVPLDVIETKKLPDPENEGGHCTRLEG